MIKVENVCVTGFEAAVRGMRNPLQSHNRSDSYMNLGEYIVGNADLNLMQRLYKAGPEHAKYLRMIHVTMDVTAPLYWWKEADQYKVGTTTNSCSTMHKLHANELTADDFSLDSMEPEEIVEIVKHNERRRLKYLETRDKKDWRALIQGLPSSYNQKRTWDFDYQTAINMIKQRTGHKLDEWNELVEILKDLPYIKEIMETKEN